MKRSGPLAGVLALLLLTGCGTGGFNGLYQSPLPGGADLGSDPYRVTVQFADVLDLVPQGSVKVNEVAVGKVEKVGLSPDNTTALVTLAVNGDVRLPANADARLRQSSLLGEKYVELAPPANTSAHGRLGDGAMIPLDRTNRNPQVEEVLGALSMLLNGGGVEELRGIIQEMNKTFAGNEEHARSLLANVDRVAGRLDAQKGEITRAIDGLNRLSATLRSQTANMTTGLDHLGPGIKTIEEQRTQLVTMLGSLDRLSGVAVDTVDRSKQDMVADLRALEPTLRKLAETGGDLPKAMGYLASYPFPEQALVPLKGDFVNVDVDLDLDLSSVLENLSRTSGPLLPIPGVSDTARPLSGLPPAPELPGAPESPDSPKHPDAPESPGSPPDPSSGKNGDLLDGLLGGR